MRCMYRYRSWYANAAAGPKDVVLVLDVSGSMATSDRIGEMKTAVQWVLNTLGEHDYATIIKYSSQATGYSRTLLRMTKNNKGKLLQWVNAFRAGGATNMYDGMKLAFDTFDVTTQQSSSGCQKIILFLTDGITNGKNPIDIIRARNEDRSVRVFTFTFGEGKGQDMMDNIACATDGISRFIPDGIVSISFHRAVLV